MNKKLESTEAVHTHTHTHNTFYRKNKEGKKQCLYKRYIHNRPIIDIMVCFLCVKFVICINNYRSILCDVRRFLFSQDSKRKVLHHRVAN